MFKQYDIKFVVTRKTLTPDIKFVLFYIVSKNDVAGKERFNLIDKPIFKPQYFDIDIFFDSDSIFNSNSDASRKINVEIFNL